MSLTAASNLKEWSGVHVVIEKYIINVEFNNWARGEETMGDKDNK